MNSKVTSLLLAAAIVSSAAHATPPVQATLALGNTTQGIAVDPAIAKTFVTSQDSATVSVIDINTLTVKAIIPVKPNPRRIIADAATHMV
jgi:YVTN family beta-propeller protein